MTNVNKAVPGAKEYYPLNEPSIGAALPTVGVLDVGIAVIPPLFHPLKIRGVTFNNRIFVSPMCQYSSDNGHATDWHFVHIGGYATRGYGGIVMEATAVVPEGRISPQDAGIWTESQIEPLKRIVDFAHAQGAKIGIQLSHAGRKASTLAPWVYANCTRTRLARTWIAKEDEDGWPDEVYGPSEVAFRHEDYPQPKAMSEQDMLYVQDAFVTAIGRCREAGFDFIELHGAHGYLLHSWLSPLSNVRGDGYGGQSLEDRLRFPLRLIRACRDAWADKPLFVRISATDWAEGPERGEDGVWKQWGLEQSKVLVRELMAMGVDLVDVSSGGNWAAQQIPVKLGYQVPFAEEMKRACPNLLVGAVGMIETPKQADKIVRYGQADVVFMARELIRNPHWPIYAAQELGVAVKPANQYERGWMAMLSPPKKSYSAL
ncbi:hypothetical protein EVG20_g3410 [Dentipellis fragilis]|uniref:NADH:flavin oxidoreductase/NADH oxidase N-terminal domain-containing protein n=1 Tax=Dentipellis fragilis TaxID=205917 RepID=A0A4Y9Z4K3_9AGAM|nr:hypothetical protein EVG20_g3410 [Dentipellis fragilis]